ncbi:hypothetical protein SAMN03159391_05183 [Pseudomonas sp. NFACC37-1]|nr:hypothetical protein SAMN03159391_05183 [Pseudomonas sp. NFACC37-1]
MWRGDLSPLGCEAAPYFRQTNPMPRVYGGCATEREQAPSPRGLWASYRSVVASKIPFYSSAHLLALVSGEGFAALTTDETLHRRMKTQANLPAFILWRLRVGDFRVCRVWSLPRSANPRVTATRLIRSKQGGNSFSLIEPNLMTTNQSSNRFTPLTPIATTQPILFIDRSAPQPELHACVSERLHANPRLPDAHGLYYPARFSRDRHQHHHQHRSDHGPGCGGCFWGD